jgi:hypothetical protein
LIPAPGSRPVSSGAQRSTPVPPPRAATPLPRFPKPFPVNGINFWTVGAIRRYQATIAGHDFIPSPVDDEWLRTDQVRIRLGNVSEMWIYRRLKEAKQLVGELHE